MEIGDDRDVAGVFVDGGVVDEFELAGRQQIVVSAQVGAAKGLLEVVAQLRGSALSSTESSLSWMTLNGTGVET
ncbi:hypothetical protein P4233_16235 [Pseudomonas aeruginosa]|nr:hypothetical protein [Pseudomonas aeruginosa]